VPKPSIYRQLDATAVSRAGLKDSPRHWNCGLLAYKGKLWMCYRFHRMTDAGRCGTAICPIDPVTFQPAGPSQMLDLGGGPTAHHEDARLFIFRGEPYISYTEMVGYRPGVDFVCTMKYAQLKLNGNRWKVLQSWQPKYGRNDGSSKEKNWAFFEDSDRLYAVYSAAGEHEVIELSGASCTTVHRAPAPVWHWGEVRGGTPPIRMADGNFLSIFHSSLPTETPPHFVRYFGAAYSFEGKPPFKPLGISMAPLMSGSEEDGHQVDPRYVEGWKPFVVFPCGIVEKGENYLVSLGVNDWQCAVARIPKARIQLGPVDGSGSPMRYFRRENGTMHAKFIGPDKREKIAVWTVPRPGPACSAGVGYLRISNPREAAELAELPGVEEITVDRFNAEMANRNTASTSFHSTGFV
jgi:predicted GH43/DUF377 family glycosyl hydrolase